MLIAAVLPDLDAEDVAYVRSHFTPLSLLRTAHGWDEASLRDAIDRQHVPRPTYVLPDRTEMVPSDYFSLVLDGSDLQTLRERFIVRLLAATEALHASLDESPDEIFNEYLGGGYGACLKTVSPESIARKSALMNEISALIAVPNTDDAQWRNALRAAVEDLDALELPFARWDRVRFGGPVSRDRLITRVRAGYPEVFAQFG